jgi:hypothetical protein
MKAEEMLGYVGLLDEAEQFKPILQKSIEVLKSYAGEFEEIIEDFIDYIRRNRIKSVRFYEGAGFTREESILMTMYDSQNIRKLLNNIKLTKK